MEKGQIFKEIIKDLKAKRVLNKKFYSVGVGIYEINKNGLKHALSRTYAKTLEGKRIEVELLKNLMLVISNSIYISFDQDMRGKQGVKGVHNYYNIVLYNAALYEVWYKIKETKDKTFFYDMGVIREVK